MPAALQSLLDTHLRPEAARIDREGHYPREFLHRLGEAGVFVAPGRHENLGPVIRSAAQVARVCGSTGFLVWCHNASAWYLANTDNAGLRARYFDEIGAARRLAGTALSNPVKHYAGIESLKLSGRRVSGGYEVSGTLPWVSNLGPDHAFAIVFSVEDSAVMAYLTADRPGLARLPGATFAALEGTATFALRFDRVFIPQADLLGLPADRFLRRVQAGFVLLQLGLGFGLIAGALDDIRDADRAHAAANQHLPDRPDALEDALHSLETRAATLAADPLNPSPACLRSVLRLRLDTAELALRATQSAALHSGARGFIATSAPQRRVREAHFFAILTPSVRHLHQALHRTVETATTPQLAHHA